MRGRGARPPVNTLGGSSAAAQAAVGVEVTRPDVVMLAGATVFRKKVGATVGCCSKGCTGGRADHR